MRFYATRTTVATAGLLAALTAGSFTWVLRRQPPRPLETFPFQYENVLGTSMDLSVVALSAVDAALAEAAVLDSIDRDAKILSSYDPDSEFSRWFETRNVPTPVSSELAEVLSLFDRWRDSTDGALDPSAERVSRVWRAAAAAGRMPTSEERAAAVEDVRRVHWRVDPVARLATHLSDTPLVLNSFTKSYIVERAAAAALAAGARGVTVNIGGDIVVRGERTETVALRDPAASADNARPMTQLLIRDRAVATSGGYRRGFDIGGTRYSHIVDPRTGESTRHVASATVVATHGTDAGALATAMCVLTPEESRRLASRTPDAEFLIVLADGSRIESRGWRTLEVPTSRRVTLPSPVATLHAFEQAWDANWELAVTFDLARPGGMSRRPYVAVWVEDKDRFPVKTLALWYEKPRWLPDLRAWNRADRLRTLAEGTSIVSIVSSATRAPGRYTLAWDGKDQQGKPVKPGLYTVAIEAAREHGTYQIMRQEIDLSGSTPKHIDLVGNLEVSAAALDYRRIAGR